MEMFFMGFWIGLCVAFCVASVLVATEKEKNEIMRE